MAQNLANFEPAFQLLNVGFYTGDGAPTFEAPKGSLYTRLDATTTTTRLYINTDGGTTWTYFTTAA